MNLRERRKDQGFGLCGAFDGLAVSWVFCVVGFFTFNRSFAGFEVH